MAKLKEEEEEAIFTVIVDNFTIIGGGIHLKKSVSIIMVWHNTSKCVKRVGSIL